jgi:UDP-N-acetylmuramoyl-tripeptide--D-alanyl-D-alanine ligase
MGMTSSLTRRREARLRFCASERGRGRLWPGLTVLEAADRLSALCAPANLVRRRSHATVIGVAGSAGKTTTKDILRSLLAPLFPTVASPASYNNQLGVSLTLSLLEAGTRVCVCELGTGGHGDLAAVCRIAEPDAGVLTAIGPEHLDSLGSLDGVAAAEAELISALRPGSCLVVPNGEPLLDQYRRDELDEWTFGLDTNADIHPREWTRVAGGTEVELDVRGETVAFRTNLVSPQHCSNMCAAVATYAALGFAIERLREGAAVVEVSPWRGEERELAGGGVLINDAYNANPLSMRAALEGFVSQPRHGRTVAILGEMAELGRQSRRWHEAIGDAAAALGVDMLVAIGPLARDYVAGSAGRIECRWFPDLRTTEDALPEVLRAGDVVLLKGSRVAGLERLAESVIAVAAGARPSRGVRVID